MSVGLPVRGREPWRMPMGKKKQQSPFTGRWRIVSMDEWDVDYVDGEGPAFIEFGTDQTAVSILGIAMPS